MKHFITIACLLICITTNGIFAVAAGLEGYILRPMHWPLRVLAVIGGLTLLIPGTVSDLIGLVIVAGIIALQVMQNKKVTREAV